MMLTRDDWIARSTNLSQTVVSFCCPVLHLDLNLLLAGCSYCSYYLGVIFDPLFVPCYDLEWPSRSFLDVENSASAVSC